MKVVRSLIFGFVVGLVSISSLANGNAYNETVAGWSSHEDVAQWLQSRFTFDNERQSMINARLKSQGAPGLLVRQPKKLFVDSRGYCADAAHFAIDALNEIDFDYNARWVFVRNGSGRPNHWVAAFDYNDKLYIMDYGTGAKWKAMQGLHGPYESLDEYRDFLASLSIPGFSVGEVLFRSMPGQED